MRTHCYRDCRRGSRGGGLRTQRFGNSCYLVTSAYSSVLSMSLSRQSCSENVVLIGVNLLESWWWAFVQNGLGWSALVLIEVVGLHAGSKLSEVCFAELGKNGLSWRILILSWEATIRSELKNRVNLTYKTTLSSTRVDFFLVPPNMCTIFSVGMTNY